MNWIILIIAGLCETAFAFCLGKTKLVDGDGVDHHLWLSMQDDPELTAVVRSRQLHIYRNGKKILVLAGKSAPKIVRQDKICEMLVNELI